MVGWVCLLHRGLYVKIFFIGENVRHIHFLHFRTSSLLSSPPTLVPGLFTQASGVPSVKDAVKGFCRLYLTGGGESDAVDTDTFIKRFELWCQTLTGSRPAESEIMSALEAQFERSSDEALLSRRQWVEAFTST